MTQLISLQIHSGFSSFSSDDKFLYLETTDNPVEFLQAMRDNGISDIAIKETDNYSDPEITIVYVEDTLFYNECLHSKRNTIFEGVAAHRMESRLQEYMDTDIGYPFSETRPVYYDEFLNTLERKEKEKRKKAGVVLWEDYEKWNEFTFRGALHDKLWHHPYVQNYLQDRGKVVFGYLGSSNRTVDSDRFFNEFVENYPYLIGRIAIWFTSSYARHFMDGYDYLDPFTTFYLIKNLDVILRDGRHCEKE